MDLASTCPSEPVLAIDQPRPRGLRRPKVLMVDDDEVTSRTLVHLLHLGGFDAHFVLTGADALSYALTAAPDAIVLDLHLANGDIPGFVVLKSLRAKYPDLPIIVVTGWYLSDEHEAEARVLGVTDYLFKPVDKSKVIASLRAAIGGSAEQSHQRFQNAAVNAERAVIHKLGRDAEEMTGGRQVVRSRPVKACLLAIGCHISSEDSAMRSRPSGVT